MTTAEMTEPTTPAPADTVPAPAAPRRLGLRVVLVIAALLEAFDALSSVPTLFGDMSEIPGPGFGGFLIKAHIAAHPVLALAVLVFAAIGRVRHAIIALAAIVFMTWLNYMPSVVLHGLEFKGVGAFETPVRVIAFPLMAACAIALAVRNQRLGIATALASIPTFYSLIGLIIFAVGVSIYGF
ncbi:MAG TPA: hypothetical protein VK512_00505 [Xanthobacteraceae bacterium]|nr:hypothetical protein [Xanthobacteraceae bacterium]